MFAYTCERLRRMAMHAKAYMIYKISGTLSWNNIPPKFILKDCCIVRLFHNNLLGLSFCNFHIYSRSEIAFFYLHAVDAVIHCLYNSFHVTIRSEYVVFLFYVCASMVKIHPMRAMKTSNSFLIQKRLMVYNCSGKGIK